MTLACEDAYSKLVEVVTVADVDAEDRVGNSLLQIWELRFGLKAKLFPLETFIEIKSTKALGRIICGAIMIAPKHFECEYGY